MKQQIGLNPYRWLLIGGGLLLLIVLLFPRTSSAPELQLSEVIALASSSQVSKIQVRGDKLNVTTVDGNSPSNIEPKLRLSPLTSIWIPVALVSTPRASKSSKTLTPLSFLD